MFRIREHNLHLLVDVTDNRIEEHAHLLAMFISLNLGSGRIEVQLTAQYE